MKKVLALVISLVLMCTMFVSCESAESILKKADEALKKSPYKMTMKMNFECDDEEINKIFSAMNLEIPVSVDGKNLSMDMDMNVMGQSASTKVVVADMVMYYDVSVLGQNIKMKATMNQEQYQKFMEESNTEMMIDPDDFGKLTVETKDGKKVVVCTEISESALKELNDMMAENLKAFNGEVSVGDVSFGVTLDDGKYESMDMSCVYSVTVNGKTCNVSFKIGAKFSYEEAAKISAPADAEKYQEVKFDEIMGG